MSRKTDPVWREEQARFAEISRLVQEDFERYTAEDEQLRIKIKELFDHYQDNNPELISDLNISIDRQRQTAEALRKAAIALEKPYFGRVDFTDLDEAAERRFYVGKHSLSRDGKTLVVDWRAPVSSVYYECDLGRGVYHAPSGEVPVELHLKRTFEVENRELREYYDTEVVANDDLLVQYLGRNKEAVLGEIVATIQREQNEIIRATPFRHLLVQGVAGSGKTTVAMHRISYILYNYEKYFRPEEFYIIGSNRMLLDYITAMLPDLDVHGVHQMTMEELLLDLLKGDYKKPKKALAVPEDDALTGHKGTPEFLESLFAYLREYEREQLPQEDLVQGEICYLSREELLEQEEKLSRRSLEERLDLLRERAAFLAQYKGEQNFLEPDEIRKQKKAMRAAFKKLPARLPLEAIYRNFLQRRQDTAAGEEEARIYARLLQRVDLKRYDLYDLCALCCIRARLRPIEKTRDIRHMVVDEAQDFGAMVFCALKSLLPECTFTIMGDVSQNINFYSGMNRWDVLRERLLTTEGDRFATLSKSYRNTIEISHLASRVLEQCSFETYPIDPVVRHGRQPEYLPPEQAAARAADCQERGLRSIGVLCRDERQAEAVKKQLGKRLTLAPEGEFSQGIMVLPVRRCKGLEFDVVFLWEPSEAAYPPDDAHAKLLYVALTRALHELYLVSETADQTPLLPENH